MFTFANFITITRLFFSFLFFYYIELFSKTSNFQDWLLGFFYYLIALLTDYLDGLIARTFKQTSIFGSYLDPICDKILIVGSLWISFLYFNLPFWFLLTYLFREENLIFYIFWLYKKNYKSLKPNNFGKVNMILIPIMVFFYSLASMFETRSIFTLLDFFSFIICSKMIRELFIYKKSFWKIIFPK